MDDNEVEELEEFTGEPIDYVNGGQLKIDGKFIGYTMKGDRGLIFVMPRFRRNMFRIFKSWGIRKSLLEELIQKCYWLIKIVVQDENKILSVKPENWMTKGFFHHSRGYEEQIQLREKDFDKIVG